jgi:mono/diheme cytochrome c family protein
MRRRLAGLMATLLAIASIAEGCGSSSGSSQSTQSTPSTQTGSGGSSSSLGNAAAGKKVFTSDCGSCHTMADAGTNGQVGPNLDELQPDFMLVRDQVTNGGGTMPAFGKQGILSAKQIDNVAAYVSSKAGQ